MCDAEYNNSLAPTKIKKRTSLELVGMKKKSVQEINFTSGQKSKGKSAVHRKSMPIVRCVCGSEILVVPDLKAMNRAIKNHVTEHKQARDGSDRLDLLTEFLTQQVLTMASNINLSILN